MPEPDASREWKPYHHGNLRTALLTAAEQTLRERGIGQVSLRDLARQAGVSHAAPGRHFRDRQALLDALAADGYTRLSDEIATAMVKAGDGCAAQLRAMAATYVRFAVENGALLDLMLAGAKADAPALGSGTAPGPGTASGPGTALGPGAVSGPGAAPGSGTSPGPGATKRPYAILGDLIRRGQETGELRPGDPERLRLIILATFQGIATLVSSRQVPAEQADALVTDATALFTRA